MASLAFLTGVYPERAGAHDLSQDFSTTANPNGVWSYGFKPTISGQFTLFPFSGSTFAENGVRVHYWAKNSSESAQVDINNSSMTATSDGGQGVFPPGSVWVCPGVEGHADNFVVIRFTVPADGAGEYRIEAFASATQDGPASGDSEFHIVKNSGLILHGEFLDPRSESGYTNVVLLLEGDSIDLMVGRGIDDRLAGSCLKIQAIIEPLAGEPPVVCVEAPDDLVAWWAMEETAGDLIGGNQGVLGAGAMFVDGEVGDGLDFDGVDDRVVIPGSPGLDVGLGDGFTIELWVKPRTVSRPQTP